MVKKTREKFIEVARQLFARQGVENTTMNDIANASDKGRRTIYTYFKSKREIFNAVIFNESEELLEHLKEIVYKPISSEWKLYEYIDTRLHKMQEIVSRNGSLKAGFFLDVRKVDRARNMIVKKEVNLIQAILEGGVRTGEFEIADVRQAAILIANFIQGLDVPFIRNGMQEFGMNENEVAQSATKLLLQGIRRKD